MRVFGFALVLLVASAASAQTLRHADVRLHLAPGEALGARLAGTGVVLDHVAAERTPTGVAYRTVLREDERAALQAAGVTVDVLVEDLTAQYADRAARAGGCPATPFPITGTHGCYPTYDEAVAILDAMRAQYPTLVSARLSIGTTGEGRDLWMIEIGDNPGVDEGEPEVFLNALHHAREPQGMASLLHAVWTALDAYGSDPVWTYLLDERRTFVVPVVNPDGYVYNQTTNPQGGGFWRKNRRDNGGNVFGVDLNRNYGFEWGYDDNGSSPTPTSDTYRGPSAFSEPETQAMRDFVQGRDIRLALNTHTYSDLLIYPWGYLPDFYTPDSAAFVDAARVMTEVNQYRAGTGNQTVGYLVNGNSDDWMYGAEDVFAFTPEIGSADDGFWPSPDRLLPLAEINVDMYRQAIWLAGGTPTVAIASAVQAPGGNGFPDPGEEITVDVRLTNTGRSDLTVSGVQPTSSNPHLTPLGSLSFAGTLAPGESALAGSYPVFVSADAPVGWTEGFGVVVTLSDGTPLPLPLGPIRIGTPVVLFESDASSLAGWTATGGWGLTSAPVASPPSAFTDSPAGPYAANVDARLTLAQPLDLTDVSGAALEFSARWAIEAGWDFGTVEASTNGTTWTPLRGLYTSPGSGNDPTTQPSGVPGYDGSQATFVRERIALDAYDGVPALRLRFRLRSDGFVEEDGWIVDDIEVSRLTNGGTVAGEGAPGAAATRLGAPSPNPSSGTVGVAVALASAGEAHLAVYDVLGRRVATVLDGALAAGTTDVVWDGRDAAGAPVAPGLYLLRLTAGPTVATRQVLVVR